MSHWVRLWDDMPNDPKWRIVARRSGRPVSEVLAVFLHMMTNAGGAKERGILEGWSDEDVAIAIDADTDHVAAIRNAMQGKTLHGEELTGWSKRQPKREDTSTDRVREYRKRLETHKLDVERAETQRNAPEEKREDTEADRSNDLTSFDRSSSAEPSDTNVIDLPRVARRKPDDTELLQSVAGLWNETARGIGLREIETLSEKRISALRARIRQLPDFGLSHDPQAAFHRWAANIRGSPFLRGENNKNWRADFDFAISPKGFVKIMEGAYEGEQGTNVGYGRH